LGGQVCLPKKEKGPRDGTGAKGGEIEKEVRKDVGRQKKEETDKSKKGEVVLMGLSTEERKKKPKSGGGVPMR